MKLRDSYRRLRRRRPMIVFWELWYAVRDFFLGVP